MKSNQQLWNTSSGTAVARLTYEKNEFAGRNGFITFFLALLLPILVGCNSGSSTTANVSEENTSTDTQTEDESQTEPEPEKEMETDTETTEQQSPANLKIMMIGDSITQGNSNQQSYRYSLWKRLVDAGVTFDFIGSLRNNFKGNPEWPDYKSLSFDRDHEGHWGWRVDEILAKIDGWLDQNLPDVILIHLGTNDVFQKQSVSSTLDELSELITRLRAKNAQTSILLAQVIPSTKNNQLLDELNVGISDLANTLSNEASAIYLVDTGSGFNPQSDTYDGVHPNASGEEKMSAIWFDSLMLVDVFK